MPSIKSNTAYFQESNSKSLTLDTDHLVNSGLYLSPTPDVPNRPSDITGFTIVADNFLGKLKWAEINLNRLANVNLINPTYGDSLCFDQSRNEWTNTTLEMNSLADIQIQHKTIEENQVLVYNGVEWINQKLNLRNFEKPRMVRQQKSIHEPIEISFEIGKIYTFPSCIIKPSEKIILTVKSSLIKAESIINITLQNAQENSKGILYCSVGGIQKGMFKIILYNISQSDAYITENQSIEIAYQIH